MRSHTKHRRKPEPQELFCDLVDLVCTSREYIPGQAVAKPRQDQWRNEALELWKRELPFCVEVVLMPVDCTCAGNPCGGEVLLERWVIEQQPTRTNCSKPVVGQLLCQAVHSHLAFSQLKAWTAGAQNPLPFTVTHRLCLPGELDQEGSSTLELHQFPLCSVDRSHNLCVCVHTRPRSANPPGLLCRPAHTTTHVQDETSRPGSSVNEVSLPATIPHHSPSTTSDFSHTSSLSTGSGGHNVYSSGESSTFRENMLFDSEMHALSLDTQSPASPVSFYISEKEERVAWRSPSKSQRRERLESGDGVKLSSHRLSRKILYSTDDDVCFVSPPQSTTFDESWKMCSQDASTSEGLRSRWDAHRKASFSESVTPGASKVTNRRAEMPSLTSRFLRRSAPCADGVFSRNTGLPLNSSPAPLKRNQHSFNFDCSLNTVAQIRNALYNNEHDSGSSDSECGTSLCKSAPASTNLLGNFEESALNGRIKPFGSVHGFTLDLAASGAFCPPHATLPVTTFFFQVSEDNAPSPYLGQCSLEPLGKKGYHLPKKGTVQATLFNPQQTVVKMFVVRYDLADMPPLCQTFVRQRTYLMPANASREDARNNNSWLRYLIHLRLSSSRSGKLYLHSDVRMLFSRKSALDGNCSDVSVADDLLPSAALDSQSMELRSFTEMPKNPKFSPRKIGRFSARGSAEYIN